MTDEHVPPWTAGPWTGPWTVDAEQPIVTANGGRTLVCDCGVPGVSRRANHAVGVADAILIAASPDMAALLPDVIACLARFGRDDECEELAHRVAVLLHRVGGQDLRPTGRGVVLAAHPLRDALAPVVAAILDDEEPIDILRHYSRDYHVEVTLMAEECAQVLLAFGMAHGVKRENPGAVPVKLVEWLKKGVT